MWGLALQVRVPGNCASVSVPWVLLTWRRFSMHLKCPYCLIFSRKFFIDAGYPVFEVGTKDKGVPSISWKHVWNRFRVSVDIYMMFKTHLQIWFCCASRDVWPCPIRDWPPDHSTTWHACCLTYIVDPTGCVDCMTARSVSSRRCHYTRGLAVQTSWLFFFYIFWICFSYIVIIFDLFVDVKRKT